MKNPVENPLVIIITELTVIKLAPNPSPKFPKWTYKPPYTGHRSKIVGGYVDSISLHALTHDLPTLSITGRIFSKMPLELSEESQILL